jgi:rubrerythrin
MTLEEAIKTAIEYESQARDVYKDAVAKTQDPAGKRIFQALADDEQLHVQYLTDRLKEWKETGKITVEELKSVIPPREKIEKEVGKLQERASVEDRGDEKQMLSKALKMEIDASGFYKKLVEEMPEEARPMFAGFLEIENRHVAAVQAELDYISGTGYWFDFKEFDME